MLQLTLTLMSLKMHEIKFNSRKKLLSLIYEKIRATLITITTITISQQTLQLVYSTISQISFDLGLLGQSL